MCDKSLFAYATATATGITIAIAALALCALPAAAATSASVANSGLSPSYSTVALKQEENLNVAAEVELFKNVVLTKIDYFLQHALPQKMQSEGEAIRAETVQRLERCAQLATSIEDVWRFKQCGAEELGKAMTELALLIPQAYSGAGSAVTHAFWFRLLKLVALV